MGSGQVDDSVQATSSQQQPALNTTRLLNKYLQDTDLVLHIGDISYANGYSSVVSFPLYLCMYTSLNRDEKIVIQDSYPIV